MQSTEAGEHPAMGKGLGRLQGKVAVVTGADSGIGRATARLFAREGAKVVCVDILESGNPRIDRLIHQDGGEAVYVQADVTMRTGCDRMVAAALQHYGDLHVLFNNVGGGVHGRIDELTDEEWSWVLNTNLNSVYYGVRAVLPHFLSKKSGNIVNNSSTFGLLATERYPAYCASKAAVVMLTRQLALEYGPGIRVNCVCPGNIDTPRVRGFPTGDKKIPGKPNPLQRVGQPEEIAYAVLFLASDESSYVTGHALVVDGGETIGP